MNKKTLRKEKVKERSVLLQDQQPFSLGLGEGFVGCSLQIQHSKLAPPPQLNEGYGARRRGKATPKFPLI